MLSTACHALAVAESTAPRGAGAVASPAPLLVFSYGNPSRGDDALGPLFVERASALPFVMAAPHWVEFLTDFQLQVEHALDLAGREAVVFVDASINCRAPFEFATVIAARDASFSSHMLSPAALLQAFVDVMGSSPPDCYVLGIRGFEFELGQPLSAAAQSHLSAALDFFAAWLEQRQHP